jgi:hypothetical protein
MQLSSGLITKYAVNELNSPAYEVCNIEFLKECLGMR